METLLIILLSLLAIFATLILISSTTFWRSVYGKHRLVTSQNLVFITGCDTGKLQLLLQSSIVICSFIYVFDRIWPFVGFSSR